MRDADGARETASAQEPTGLPGLRGDATLGEAMAYCQARHYGVRLVSPARPPAMPNQDRDAPYEAIVRWYRHDIHARDEVSATRALVCAVLAMDALRAAYRGYAATAH